MITGRKKDGSPTISGTPAFFGGENYFVNNSLFIFE